MIAQLAGQTVLENHLEQFELKNADRVNQYLRQYPYLLPLLFEAKSQIARLFNLEAKTAIEVVADPSDGSSQLYLIVSTNLSSEDTGALFEKLDQEWWLEASERGKFRMNIVPEFA